MAQGDGGYALPLEFTKDTVLQIFGYDTAEELEGFLRKCPRHYLRNYFAEVYLGSADRVHEIRSNNDKYLLNKLVQAIRAAGIPVDLGGRRQAKGKAAERLDPKPARDSPQKAQQRPADRAVQPASFSMTARAGPGPQQPPAGLAQLPLPAQLAGGGQWAGEAGAGVAQAQQLAQLQALVQQQQMLLPGLLQYYQALLPALHQMQVLSPQLGPQAQLRQLAALQAAAPGVLLEGAGGLALLPVQGVFAAPEQLQPRQQRPRACLTELRPGGDPGSPATPAETASGTTESAGACREREQEAGSELEPESPQRVPGHKRPAGLKRDRVAQPSRLAVAGGGVPRKARTSRSSTRSSPDPASDDSAAAFRALLSAVEVVQNEDL